MISHLFLIKLTKGVLSFTCCIDSELLYPLQSLNILLEVGPPMYLGFLIHVFLHFVIIQTKIGRQLLAELENGYSSFGTVSTISEYFDAEDDPDLV